MEIVIHYKKSSNKFQHKLCTRSNTQTDHRSTLQHKCASCRKISGNGGGVSVPRARDQKREVVGLCVERNVYLFDNGCRVCMEVAFWLYFKDYRRN